MSAPEHGDDVELTTTMTSAEPVAYTARDGAPWTKVPDPPAGATGRLTGALVKLAQTLHTLPLDALPELHHLDASLFGEEPEPLVRAFVRRTGPTAGQLHSLAIWAEYLDDLTFPFTPRERDHARTWAAIEGRIGGVRLTLLGGSVPRSQLPRTLAELRQLAIREGVTT